MARVNPGKRTRLQECQAANAALWDFIESLTKPTSYTDAEYATWVLNRCEQMLSVRDR